MNIIIERLNEQSLEDFADKHGLTMKVCERENPEYGMRFYASFQGVEVKDGSILKSEYGNGDDPDSAIRYYAYQISHKYLVKDAYGVNRQEFTAPKLRYAGKNGTHNK